MDISTRQQIWKDMYGNIVEKAAELAGTYDMPLTQPDKKGKKAAIVKTAVAESSEDLLKLAFAPDDNEDEPVSSKQPEQLPQAASPTRTLKPHVDVSGQEPPSKTTKKQAQYYALPSTQRYPLDGYDQVVKAAAYFDEWRGHMPPAMRHEYCQNLVKRASALSIPVSTDVECYGSSAYGSRTQIKVALDARRSVVGGEDLTLLEKVAEKQPRLLPEDFAVLLGEFDKAAGIEHLYDTEIPDPYFSTFAKLAVTESGTSPAGAVVVGNEYITHRDLVRCSKQYQKLVENRFGEEFALEFAKDPLGIFNSLPRDEKLVLMRLANSSKELVSRASE